MKTKAGKLYTNDLAGYSKTLNECYLATPDDEMVEKIKGYIDAIPTAALRQMKFFYILSYKINIIIAF